MSEICPYCHAPVQDNTSKCTYCLKPIDRCILCHAPIVPESTVCSLCGGFPLPEPRLNMNVWVEGGVYLDEYGVIMVHLSNTGNNPTSVSIHIAADKGIDPIKFDDNIESLHPGMGVERSYKFKITEITRITFKDITATYIHRDGGKDTLKLQPFTFESYGRPVVNIDFNKKEVDLKLGEVNKIYFNVLNNGTEKVGKMNIFINISPSIEV
ncbi:MAG: zinc ribbon domain-containing protein, partial [Candidatus Thermoplasmatota archaeon]|nr:zinc ribbon domain-containing protein [Candidatus Thermoplasmatota archaeon]